MRDPRDFLDGATREWVDDDVITSDQREAILGRYPVADKRKRQASILSILGAVLVGVGAILFVATNWEVIPRWLRLVTLFGAMVGAHLGGWQLQTRTNSSPRVGHALHVLGTLLFGATLFLVAQLYNVNANAPWLLGLWLVGAAPFAWGLASRPLLALSIGIAGLWLGFEAAHAMMLQRADVWEPAAFMVPFFAFGVLLWGLGRLHAGWERLAPFQHFSPWLRGFGLLGIAAGLYAFTFDFGGAERGDVGFALGLLPFTLAALGVGVAGSVWWARAPARTQPALAWAETGTIAALALLMLALSFAPAAFGNAVLFNIVLALVILGIVLLGVQRGDELLINMGLAFFVIDVITRYFDFFFDLLDRSIFFIVGGLILLGGGWLLERSRKGLLERAREVET